MPTGQWRDGVARRVPGAALVLLPAALILCPTEASARPLRRLPVQPYFVKLDPSRTVLEWQAVSHRHGGRFQLLRGREGHPFRVAAVLPALEGTHTYRYVDPELPAEEEIVYHLVYAGGGSEVVLVRARVVRQSMREPATTPAVARDADPGRVVDCAAFLIPSPAPAPPASATPAEALDRPRPPTPPPERRT
jgi:hypothetical protein